MITVKRFSAVWCQPCKLVGPILNELSEELSDVKFETIDVDEYPELATKYAIRSVPTVLVINDDKIVHTIVGAKGKADYKKFIYSARESA